MNFWTRHLGTISCVGSEISQCRRSSENLTIHKAQEMAQGMECADQSTKDLKTDTVTLAIEDVHLTTGLATTKPGKCYCVEDAMMTPTPANSRTQFVKSAVNWGTSRWSVKPQARLQLPHRGHSRGIQSYCW